MLRRFSIALLCSTASIAVAQKSLSFRDYAVPLAFHGKPVPALRNTLNSRTYRTKIREAVAAGPNFADHYTLAIWGCGSSCAMFSIVDANDGRVYDFPFGVSWVDEALAGVNFHRNSKAVRIVGQLNEDGDSKDRWYVWDGKALVRKSERLPCHMETQNCDNQQAAKKTAHR
jgi:hypothetical protein